MAVFSFRTTEDDRPGGGVYKLPGNGPTWTIRQSDYPNVNLSGLTNKNFFLSTRCNASGQASVSTDYHETVERSYNGGNSGSVSYSYSGGVGTVTVVGAVNRSVKIYTYEGSGPSTASAGYTHTLYMSRTPIT